MAQQTLNGLYVDPWAWQNTSYTSFLIDASAEKVAFIFQVPKSGNINKVGFRTGTVTTSDTLRLTIQTLDASGNPSGSVYGSCVKGTRASLSSNTWYEVTLGTAATATAGDLVAAVIEYDSYVSGNLNIAGVIASVSQNFPHTQHYTTSWGKSANAPVCSIGYDDGTYPLTGMMPFSAINTLALNTGTTPDEFALRFKVPFPCKVMGVKLVSQASATTADFDIVLYDSASSAVGTITYDALTMGATASNRQHWLFFASPVTLTPNSVYRLCYKPTTANNVSLVYMSVNANAVMEQFPGGIEWYASTRTDAGAWTDVTTDRPQLYPIFGAFADDVKVPMAIE